jgi:hypothetical protein
MMEMQKRQRIEISDRFQRHLEEVMKVSSMIRRTLNDSKWRAVKP